MANVKELEKSDRLFMPTARDIPPSVLIKELALELKEIPEIKPPEWAKFVKTGVFKELPPEDIDWWYTRAAAVMRRIYLDGPIGVEHLRAKFGGRYNRGTKPEKFRPASGNIIRKILQQLEEAGFATQEQKKGRILTPKGISFIDKLAAKIARKHNIKVGV